MKALSLKINSITPSQNSDSVILPTDLTIWVKSLPLGDTLAAAEKLAFLLRQYNHGQLDPMARFNALNTLAQSFREIVNSLSVKYQNSTFPLTPRNSQRFSVCYELISEYAIGYKIIIIELHNKTNSDAKLELLFFNALRKAIIQLSRLLLECYIAYAQEPQDIWADLNQIYAIAEKYGVNNLVLGQQEKKLLAMQTIQHAYLQIALLATINPYQLMQNEARSLFIQLKDWAKGCRIVKRDSNEAINNQSVVADLNSHNSPCFYHCGLVLDPDGLRIIDITDLRQHVKSELLAMTRQYEGAPQQASFNHRMRIEMLKRLREIWKTRQERKHKRNSANEQLALVTGLSAVHFTLDGQKEFLPERDELHLQKGSNQTSSLSLVPTEYEPWKTDELDNQIATGMFNTRVSDFDLEHDIWKKISTSELDAGSQRNTVVRQSKPHTWNVFNFSDDGLGLRSSPETDLKLRVGDIAIWNIGINLQECCLGVVRWQKAAATDEIEIGLRKLKGKPQPVAVRAVQGTGSGSEYFRALLFQRDDPNRNQQTIIVPANIYQCGTEILINSGTQLSNIMLANLLMTTNMFSEFEFSQIDNNISPS